MKPRTSLAVVAVLVTTMVAGCAGTTNPTVTAPLTASPTQVGAATPSPTLEAAPAFVKGQVISVIPGSWMGLAAADLNEDGKLDLVTTTSSRLGVVNLLGRGDGTFEAESDIEVAPSDSVRAADLNGDGHVDLIAGGDQLAVLLGNGDGTFKAPVYYPVGSGPGTDRLNVWGLAVADLNGDKIPDIVAANWVGSQVAVLLGKGDGTFGPASLYPCPDCIGVALGDLNRDGAIDVVAASVPASPAGHSVGQLFVFLNDGKGRLSVPVKYDPQGNSVGVALGDLNGDGALDMITANDQAFSVSVLLGKGDGTFAQAQTYPAGNTHSVAVVDLDGDGKLDVLSGSLADPKVWFYRGVGDGQLIETQGIAANTNSTGGLLAVDLNGDGKPDVALTESNSHGTVSIFLQK